MKHQAVRRAQPGDLDRVYMMGYDTWGDGDTRQLHLEACRASEKYQRGHWYVSCDDDLPVSSLIVYAEGFRLPEDCHGIGSVATDPAGRGQGHASRLMGEVSAILQAEGSRGIYLFSDIDPGFYRQLGFEPVAVQEYPDSCCMVLAFRDNKQLLSSSPSYF